MKTGFFTAVRYRWILGVLLIVTVCCSAIRGYAAQSYYPDELGNTWFLRSTDGIDERTVTIKGPETINGKALKIIEEKTNDNINQL